LLPRFLARQQKGLLRLPGNGDYLIDTTYVDNAAVAHLQAFEALQKKAPVSGKAYFISQDKPITIRAFVDMLLEAGGLPPVNKTIHPQLAIMIGWLLQRIFRTLRLQGEPPLTHFVAKQLSSSHWYNISAAKRDFGYQPVISIEEGMRRTKAWFKAKQLSGD
jgi:nucleoside-diphosphate-sugar epimerase